MNPLFLLRVLSRWEIITVSALCMILIPLASYLASLRPRQRRNEFMAPVEKALEEAPEGRGS